MSSNILLKLHTGQHFDPHMATNILRLYITMADRRDVRIDDGFLVAPAMKAHEFYLAIKVGGSAEELARGLRQMAELVLMNLEEAEDQLGNDQGSEH